MTASIQAVCGRFNAGACAMRQIQSCGNAGRVFNGCVLPREKNLMGANLENPGGKQALV
jgi:hypothetical protein